MTSDFPGDLRRFSFMTNDVTRNLDIAPNVRRGLHVHAQTHAHVSTDDDGEDKDTRHLRYDSCNVATDIRGRGREAGREDKYACVCLPVTCVRMCLCMYMRKGCCRSPVRR